MNVGQQTLDEQIQQREGFIRALVQDIQEVQFGFLIFPNYFFFVWFTGLQNQMRLFIKLQKFVSKPQKIEFS